MNIAYIDGPILKPLFKFLRKTGIGIPYVLLALKVIEYLGNGLYKNGRYNQERVKWTTFSHLLLIGQSHQDAAWRWRTKQGILKTRATFEKALDHIQELPEFTFTQPSPQYFQWMKSNFPDLYGRIKLAVKTGHFIPFGGSWVEMDTNLPDGESIVRQRLYGQRFFLKEFGFCSDIEFLQDCFGFNWNLPQIFKKSGAKMFGTGKLFWNDTAKIPIGMALWQGPDGSLIPMIHLNFGYFLPIIYGKEYPLIYLLGKSGEKLIANYRTPVKEYRRWRSHELMLDNVFGYGIGDGGHGPIEFEINIVSFLRRLWPKIFKFYQKGDFYALFKKYYPRWAIWNDEWYLDIHRGTYTTISRIKRGNRDCENRIKELEIWNTITNLIIKSNPLKEIQNTFETYWKILLYNQFHDILPGSSIPEVYIDYDQDRSKLEHFFSHISASLNNQWLYQYPINPQWGIPIIIFNSLSWERQDLLTVKIGTHTQGILRDRTGNPLTSQIVEDRWGSLHPHPDQFLALTIPPSVPSIGWDLLYFDPTQESSFIDYQLTVLDHARAGETKADYVLENQHLRVKIDPFTGWLTEIYSKELKKNILLGPSNKVVIFEEHEHTDAWNIDPGYRNNPVNYSSTPISIQIREIGPIRSMIEISYQCRNSHIVQRVALISQSPVVWLSMDIDLQDPQLLYKLEFNTIINTDVVSSEIPYAYIDRTVCPQTLLDRARWEHCGQKWVSVSDGTIGFTLINNGKYGYSVRRGTAGNTIIEPSIIRSPRFTGYAKETRFVNRNSDGGLDPAMPRFTDLELHQDIQFGILIHNGNWRNDAWCRAYELNHPLNGKIEENTSPKPISKSINDPITTLPFSFLTLVPTSVQCTAIKFPENIDNPSTEYKQIILRLIERIGKKTLVTLRFMKKFQIIGMDEVDLLELHPKRIAQSSYHETQVEINPYEILTLQITLKLD
jgi:alpha-mannosidase